ncbi:MAG: hypothetical protein N2323_02230 [candidate division WOR-3 bacterium]|nr:hypothetical protein [candidate division WOR-3 bacterium]MCX7836765.1 hypothetical protein [candidate division WOR-3 bacterium]MDW8113597.1 hypothetical protein [candidate division WOR-3 bacterium]
MKKIVILIIFITQVFPYLWVEKPSWYWNGERWLSQTLKPWARGRLWLYLNPATDSCNKEQWEIPFTDSISVAQWIKWSIDGKKTLWRIRKFGEFAGIGPIIWIKSNADVVISFAGFENPTNGENQIEKYYYFTNNAVNEPGCNWEWISARDLNNYRIRLNFPSSLEPQIIKMWERIIVDQCDRACEYVDPGGATIILTLTVIKPWIDKRSGFFKSLPIEPSLIDIEN